MSSFDNNDTKFSTDFSRFSVITMYMGLLVIVLGILFLVLGCFRISSYAFRTYESIDKIPHNRVGLLFGTSPLDSSGAPNAYFDTRIMAASQLFKAGKIDYVLVSGDNRHESYNEPRFMKKYLIKAGVPADRIVFDFAGIRTLDSVVRARKVFLLKSVTFISQGFQNERALFIADKNDLNAVGYNAINPSDSFISFVGIREFFARIKCVLDVYVLGTEPKFLGKPETIGKNPMPKNLSSKPKKLTSSLKLISDSAFVIRQQEMIAKYAPLAKPLTDNAKLERAKQERFEHEYDKNQADSYVVDNEQNEILKEEQNEALQEANEVALDSLNAGGGNTYIDPNESLDASTVGNDTSRRETPKKRTVVRQGIKKAHGDPWDYY